MKSLNPKDRVPFVVSERERLDTPPEGRKIAALEHIAHYLDRIDISLERLVTLAEEQAKAARK